MLQQRTNSAVPTHGRDRAAGPPIAVLLVDDHPALRYGIRRLIAEEPGMIMIAEHGDASADTSDAARWPDVAVVDYHLGARDGLWLTRQIKQRPSAPRVLIYSAFTDQALAVASIIAGADGLLPKGALAEELSIAIRRLVHGRQYFPGIPQPVTAALCSRLEPGDQATFSMLIHGVPPAEIMARLGLTPDELEARRQAMLGAIAPKATRARILEAAHSPLDYDRPRRRRRHPGTQ